MAHYQVIVQWRNGQPASGQRVSLSGTSMLSGLSKSEYTDKNGRAIIEMESGGEVKVYVNGTEHGRTRPGNYIVTL